MMKIDYEVGTERLQRIIMLLKQENIRLKDNWVKLREYIKDFIPETYIYNKPYGKIYKQGQVDVSQAILLKMFELERKC